jgi:DNA modification methylase
MVFADPPYGMGKEKDGVFGDNLYGGKLLEFNKTWISLCLKLLKPSGSFYCWGIDEPLMDIYAWLKPMINEHEITFRNLITWKKGSRCRGMNSMLLKCYARNDEKCLFFMKGFQANYGLSRNTDFFQGFEPIRGYIESESRKAGLTPGRIKELFGVSGRHWFSRNTWEFMTREQYEEIATTFKGKYFTRSYNELKEQYDKVKQEFEKQRAYFNNTHENMTNVWDMPTASPTERSETGDHPTPKPLKLCNRAVNTSCPPDGVCLDPFMGSGTAGKACVNLGRRFIGIEIQEKYFDIACKRIELAALQGRLNFAGGPPNPEKDGKRENSQKRSF